jgi:hypothetical protein
MLVTVAELSKRLVQPPAEDTPDYDRAEAALEDASALVLSETGQSWDDEHPAPVVVRTIVIRAAIRAYLNPTGASSRSMGPFSEQIPDGVYLTDDEKRILSRFDISTSSTTIQVAQIDNDVWRPRDVVYFHDQFGGDAIPFVDSEDFGVTGDW